MPGYYQAKHKSDAPFDSSSCDTAFSNWFNLRSHNTLAFLRSCNCLQLILSLTGHQVISAQLCLLPGLLPQLALSLRRPRSVPARRTAKATGEEEPLDHVSNAVAGRCDVIDHGRARIAIDSAGTASIFRSQSGHPVRQIVTGHKSICRARCKVAAEPFHHSTPPNTPAMSNLLLLPTTTMAIIHTRWPSMIQLTTQMQMTISWMWPSRLGDSVSRKDSEATAGLTSPVK